MRSSVPTAGLALWRLFFGKLFEIEIVIILHNDIAKFEQNNAGVVLILEVLTHPLYSASFGELYARSQSWYASSGPQTAKLIIL